MDEKQLLEAVRQIVQEETRRIVQEETRQIVKEEMQHELKPIKQDIAQMKEDLTITRSAVNTLLEWAEEAQVQVKIPLFKKAE